MQLLRLIFVVLCVTLINSQLHANYKRIEGPFGKEYAGKRLDLVAKFIPENPMIFEAGGHYGNDTAVFAAKWPKSTIHSFEPNPNAFKKLLETTKDLANVHGHNIAVNTYNGTATLNVCYGTTGDNPIFEGASSLLEPSDSMKIHYQGPKVQVPCVILQDWCQQNGVDHFDFMWLDLEGLELQTLKSSPKVLAKVKVIYTETNYYKFREGTTQYNDLKKFLEKNGFVLAAGWVYSEGTQGDAMFVRRELLHLGNK